MMENVTAIESEEILVTLFLLTYEYFATVLRLGDFEKRLKTLFPWMYAEHPFHFEMRRKFFSQPQFVVFVCPLPSTRYHMHLCRAAEKCENASVLIVFSDLHWESEGSKKTRNKKTDAMSSLAGLAGVCFHRYHSQSHVSYEIIWGWANHHI